MLIQSPKVVVVLGVVIQMWRTDPGPTISASVIVSPARTGQLVGVPAGPVEGRVPSGPHFVLQPGQIPSDVLPNPIVLLLPTAFRGVGEDYTTAARTRS